VFDFTKVRNISRKIVIEDDPVKIDRYLAKLHATVTKECKMVAPQSGSISSNPKPDLPSDRHKNSAPRPQKNRRKNAYLQSMWKR
jgi:hypothetical protein